MSSTPQFIRAFATLTFLLASVSTGTPAWSQASDDQSQSTGEQSSQADSGEDDNVEDDATDTNNAEESTNQSIADTENKADDEATLAELDALLLGPWVILSVDATKTPDNKALETSISRCFEIPKLEQLDIDPAAEKKLPDAKSFLGDLVYYRTEKGLQRIDMKLGKVVLFSEIRKVEKEGKKPFWAIKGTTGVVALRFADTKGRGGRGLFMLENERVYLKCIPGPDSDSDNKSGDEEPTDQ